MYHCKLFLRVPDSYLRCLDYDIPTLDLAQPPAVGMRLYLNVQGIPSEPCTFEITDVNIHPVNDAGWAPWLERGEWTEDVDAIEYWCNCELRAPKLGAELVRERGADGVARYSEILVDFIDENGLWARAEIPWEEVTRRAIVHNDKDEGDAE